MHLQWFNRWKLSFTYCNNSNCLTKLNSQFIRRLQTIFTWVVAIQSHDASKVPGVCVGYFRYFVVSILRLGAQLS